MSIKTFARSARGILGGFTTPPHYPPGHYYSALSSRADARRAQAWASADEPPGLEIDHKAMRALAEELAPMWSHINVSSRYHSSDMYCLADAMVYHSMLRHLQPARVVEIGSGFSTAVALDASEDHALDLSVTCIEPYPDRLQALLRPGDRVDLHRAMVQDVPLETYDELAANDILFIDSTHVVKAGSDVVWNMLRILPRLNPGVVVHIHDMFWPFEYKSKWLAERKDWTELYLVHAFLIGNVDWEVMLFNDCVWTRDTDLVHRYAATTAGERPGGLWLRRR